MGVDSDHADVLRERTDNRGREATLPTDHDRNLSSADDVGGYPGDAADHLCRRSEGGRVAEAGHGDLEQVSLVVHPEGLEGVRGLADRPRPDSGASAAR